jgi:diguanylate cyclase (GGDEF)-like protein/PAS domain S-box-containing protein
MQTLVEQAADVLLMVSELGVVAGHNVNHALGHERSAIAGQSVFDLVHPDDRAHVGREFARTLDDGGEPDPFECRVRAEDGSWHVLEFTIRNRLDDPLANAMVLVGHDITARNEDADALRRSEARYRRLVEESSDIVGVLDASGVFTEANPQACRLVGLSKEEIVGTGPMDLVHPDDLERVQAAFASILEDPTATPCVEFRVRHSDGSWRSIESYPSNHLDEPSIHGVVLKSRDVTEIRKADAVGRRNDERFRSLVQNGSDIIAVIGRDRRLQYISPSVEHIMGVSAEEVLSQSTFTLTHPDDRHLVHALLDEVFGAGQGARASVEVRGQHRDGTCRWLQIVTTNELDNPAVEGVVHNVRDITERKEAELALRRSEERFRTLAQHASDITTVVNDDNTFQYVSPSVERVMGLNPDAVVGALGSTFVHPDDVEKIQGHNARVRATSGSQVVDEVRCLHADGSWRWIEIVSTNHLENPAVHGIVNNIRDVTERTERELSERRSNERFSGLVQHGSDIIAVLDEDWLIQYVSPAVERVFGYTAESLVGQTALSFGHPDDLHSRNTFFNRMMASPGAHGVLEMRAPHADGTWRWVEMSVTNMMDNPAVAAIVLNARDVTERKEVEKLLAHQALHDSLTGLPNRVLLADRIDHALVRAGREGRNVGVVFLDFDRFKLVNDTRGHAVGDELLIAVSRRLRAATRASDTVARFGGDEFVIVYEDLVDERQLIDRADHLREALAAPFDIDGSRLYVPISVGVTLGVPGSSPEGLLRDADAAMYHAKEHGGDSIEVFDESIRRNSHSRLEAERSLRAALEQDEFVIAYQPIVEIDTGRLVALEALLRWQHPDHGLVSPAEFIPLAEQTGMIIAIGRQTLERACVQVAEWRCEPGAADLTMSVNISPLQLRDPTLPTQVAMALHAASLDASALTLEITESLLIEDTETCLNGLTALSELGVHLTVDDFGTRYSSLGYLNRMHLNGLKIDQSFVHHLGDLPQEKAIVAAIVAMADALELSVVAEGVETESQRVQLRELGCHLAQGYLFARPVNADEARCLVRAGFVHPTS